MKVGYEAKPKQYGGLFLSLNEFPDVSEASLCLVGVMGGH
jgi:hypothetical protein